MAYNSPHKIYFLPLKVLAGLLSSGISRRPLAIFLSPAAKELAQFIYFTIAFISLLLISIFLPFMLLSRQPLILSSRVSFPLLLASSRCYLNDAPTRHKVFLIVPASI